MGILNCELSTTWQSRTARLLSGADSAAPAVHVVVTTISAQGADNSRFATHDWCEKMVPVQGLEPRTTRI